MRSIFVGILIVIFTPALVFLILVGRIFGFGHQPGGLFDKIPRWWSRIMLWGVGARLRVHFAERISAGQPRVFVCNHLSWFDVFAMAAALPRGKYVAKAELFSIPILSFGMRTVGMIRLERANRKAAFASYEVAARQIRDGTPVIVYPEGTRQKSYTLGPFKKGPFVLAIASGVPIVPVVMYGQREVMGKGDWRMRAGTIDVYFLDEVPTAGYSYEERDKLVAIVRDRMAAALKEYHDVPEPEDTLRRRAAAADSGPAATPPGSPGSRARATG
jgi:1-acyl-sn-glycerol-3-phosphate acyltransferase